MACFHFHHLSLTPFRSRLTAWAAELRAQRESEAGWRWPATPSSRARSPLPQAARGSTARTVSASSGAGGGKRLPSGHQLRPGRWPRLGTRCHAQEGAGGGGGRASGGPCIPRCQPSAFKLPIGATVPLHPTDLLSPPRGLALPCVPATGKRFFRGMTCPRRIPPPSSLRREVSVPSAGPPIRRGPPQPSSVPAKSAGERTKDSTYNFATSIKSLRKGAWFFQRGGASITARLPSDRPVGCSGLGRPHNLWKPSVGYFLPVFRLVILFVFSQPD